MVLMPFFKFVAQSTMARSEPGLAICSIRRTNHLSNWRWRPDPPHSGQSLLRLFESDSKLREDELRAEFEKLGRANANLRAKNREANREAKTKAARIAELEEQLVQLEKQSAARAAGVDDNRASPAPKSRRARHREIDPGDSVPPGVAVEEPAPLDLEAETALANLEERLVDEAPLDVDAETARENVEERLGGE